MSLESLISDYGYLAVGIGTFLEGETILILGGFAAHRGYLDLGWVIVSAFLGTLAGDQLFYYIGRFKGQAFIESRPNWKAKSEKVFRWLQVHEIWLILGFRFVYGMRSVTPFVIGASDIAPVRFLLLNAIGAALWAVVIGTLGYLFGQTLEVLMGDIRKYELLVVAVLVMIGLIVWLISLKRQTLSND